MAEQIYANMPESDKSAMQAYARGVNAYIESHRGRYGVEFTLIGYDPRPWSVVDSLLCGLQMFRTLTSDWKNKLIKQQMLRGGEPDKVNFLFPSRSGFEFMPGGDDHPGSNAWAVSGAHSATGKPLLSNDMHLEFSIPGIWHMEYLEAPGMKVSGVSLPGMPGILSGHNDRIAWGETNLGFDVQDLYIEKLDLRTGQYLFDGKIEQARPERELIEIKRAPAGRTCHLGDAPWPGFSNRKRRSHDAAVVGRRARSCRGRLPRHRPRPQLGRVQTRDLSLRRTGPKLCLCGCGWQHRISRQRQTAHPARVCRRHPG